MGPLVEDPSLYVPQQNVHLIPAWTDAGPGGVLMTAFGNTFPASSQETSLHAGQCHS